MTGRPKRQAPRFRCDAPPPAMQRGDRGPVRFVTRRVEEAAVVTVLAVAMSGTLQGGRLIEPSDREQNIKRYLTVDRRNESDAREMAVDPNA